MNNARQDKLYTAFWRDSFIRRRCLILMSAWCEAEGERGRMTRTWYALPEQDLFAVAEIWRRWTDSAPDEAFGLCVTCSDELVVDRSGKLLSSRR